jgi:hypothetical protein
MLIIFVGTELCITFMQSITNKLSTKKNFYYEKKITLFNFNYAVFRIVN